MGNSSCCLEITLWFSLAAQTDWQDISVQRGQSTAPSVMAAFQRDHAATKPRALASITLKAQCGPVAALLCVLSSGGSHITPLSRNPDAEHPLAWSIQNVTLFTYPHHQARKGRADWVRGMPAAESSDLPKYHSLPPMSLCVGHTYFSWHTGRTPYCQVSLSLNQQFPVYSFSKSWSPNVQYRRF